MQDREELTQTILKHFLNDLIESTKPLNLDETIDFMKKLSLYLKGVYNHQPYNAEFDFLAEPFDDEAFIQDEFLNPYRNKMQAFMKSGLKYYFSKDDDSKMILFQKLKITEPIFTYEEYEDYISRVFTILKKLLEKLYLKPPASFEAKSIGQENLIEESDIIISPTFKSKSNEYTRTRQVLLYYYMLKLMNMTKQDNSARKYAQFAHVLFGWPIDNIDNSRIYKLLKTAPDLKTDIKALLIDLEYIKSQFERVESMVGMALVQKDIDARKPKQ